MSSPAKKRKLNNGEPSSKPTHGLLHFFKKQQEAKKPRRRPQTFLLPDFVDPVEQPVRSGGWWSPPTLEV